MTILRALNPACSPRWRCRSGPADACFGGLPTFFRRLRMCDGIIGRGAHPTSKCAEKSLAHEEAGGTF